MGLTCSKCSDPDETTPTPTKKKNDCIDPFMHDLMKRSIVYTTGGNGSSVASNSTAKCENNGQHHLLFKRPKGVMYSSNKNSHLSLSSSSSSTTMVQYPIRLVVRRRTVRSSEEGTNGTHIYAIRFPLDQPLKREMTTTTTATTMTPQQEQCPEQQPQSSSSSNSNKNAPITTTHRIVKPKKAAPAQLKEVKVDQLFTRAAMMAEPKYRVTGWYTVSTDHKVYIVDTGLSALDCDDLIEITEHACRGQYAAYTYAKQTLGCREFPNLALAAQDIVHSVVHAIYEKFDASQLLLDDREPHMVKYDVTKKERQKLDMHTDKSEWTFLIALSNGCGVDYDGGGTYLECLDATIHIQRGQALIFPGKLRHCGQRITSGLRFLLVGFLVDKTASAVKVSCNNSSPSASTPPLLSPPPPHPPVRVDDALAAPAPLGHTSNIP